MLSRQPILEIPRTLRETLEQTPAQYAEVVRRVRWGDGPIYLTGTGPLAALGLTGAYAFETLLGWPVVARPVDVLLNYTPSLARPTSVLLVISAGGEESETQELARVAQRRGCTVILLTNSAESPLAQGADHLLVVRVQGDAGTPALIVCLHAALINLAMVAARILRPSRTLQASLEKEFASLPGKLDWILVQHAAAVRRLASKLIRFSRLEVVGGGGYHFSALHAARRLRAMVGLAAEGIDVTEFSPGLARREDGVLFLSSSRSEIKKIIHRAAAEARVRGMRVFSITDTNDRELAERSDLALLLPTLVEAAGCTLAVFLAEWLAVEVARIPKPASS